MKHTLTLALLALHSLAALAQTTTAPTEAEVRKVDLGTQKITLKHGEIKNLDMPAMTMVFGVKEPQLLDNIKPGDRVLFTADKLNGSYTVITLKAATGGAPK